MTSAAVGRKAVELEAKLRTLETELGVWLAESGEGRSLQKHNSQIEAVAATLETPLRDAHDRLAAARHQSLLSEALDLEVMILELHRVWDFFRSKLALRYVEHFRQPLLVASELAWRCFEPAESHVPPGQGLEPPLVYFNGASSPLTLERGKRFAPEVVEGEPLSSKVTAVAIESLPVAVLGLPWFQVDHLPDAPIIAHEVGHDVEVDLGLGARVRELVYGALGGADADADHLDAWDSWSGEVFADVYGTVALGPAFATTLIDFLAADPDDVAAERQEPGKWSAYPTTALRLLLAAAVLEATDFAEEAEAVRQSVPPHAMQDYDPEVERVADALVRGRYAEIGDAPLPSLISFSRARHAQADADASRLLKRMAPLNSDARVLVAAARIAFDRDPDVYVGTGVNQRVLDRVEQTQGVGVRAGPAKDREGFEVVAARAKRRDQAAGEALTRLLEGATASGKPANAGRERGPTSVK
jgi:hypothetical protein